MERRGVNVIASPANKLVAQNDGRWIAALASLLFFLQSTHSDLLILWIDSVHALLAARRHVIFLGGRFLFIKPRCFHEISYPLAAAAS